MGRLQVDQLLLEMHLFMKAHPRRVWRQLGDDRPLQTIKSLVHNLDQLIGDEVRPARAALHWRAVN